MLKQFSSSKYVAILVVVGAVVLVCGTWFLATRLVSPTQRQAQAKPPAARAVTAKIVRQDLAETTTANAKAEFAESTDLPIPAGEGGGVITRSGAAKGENVSSGSVLVWVNGRPLFVFAGSFLLYRDVSEGMSGDDVLLVQKALNAAGYQVRADGTFGSYTATCIKGLYRRAGSKAQIGESSPENEAEGKDPGRGKKSESKAPSAGKVVLPASEVVVSDKLPAKVVDLPNVGTSVDGKNTKVKLSGGKMSLVATVPSAVGVKVKNGLTGKAEASGKTLRVKVAQVQTQEQKDKSEPAPEQGDAPEGADTSQNMSRIVFSPSEADIPEEWAGNDAVLVTLNLSEPVKGALVVPQRAVAFGADGAANILLQKGKTFTKTKVVSNKCMQGMCAVEGAGVREGAIVRIDR